MDGYLLNLQAVLNKAGIKAQIKQLENETSFRLDMKGMDTAQKGFTNLNKEIKSTNTHTNNLNASFVDITKKVGKFLLATTVIGGFTTVISSAVDAVFDFDEALTEMKKVSDLSGEALDDYTEKLGDLGDAVARTRILKNVREYTVMYI